MRGEVYASGQHVATYADGTIYFAHRDWLGTERKRTTIDNSTYSTWRSYPFGEGSAVDDPTPTHFTGKERDTETTLDYFGGRYYGSNIGCWMSPDSAAHPSAVPYADFNNPQSLNLYSYLGNSPVSGSDVDGHCWPFCDVVARVAASVSYFLATHSDIQRDAEKAGDRASVKVTASAGFTTHSNELPASGEALAGIYAKVSKQSIEGGGTANLSAQVLGTGVQGTGDAPVFKDGSFINPLKSRTGEISPIVAGETKGGTVAVSGNEETTLSYSFGEGAIIGIEVSTGLGEVLGDILGAIYDGYATSVENIKNSSNGVPGSTNPGTPVPNAQRSLVQQ